MNEIQERIIAALREKGPMDSTQLCEALGLNWTAFSIQLMDMIKTTFNPKGQIMSTSKGERRVYHLLDQKVE